MINDERLHLLLLGIRALLGQLIQGLLLSSNILCVLDIRIIRILINPIRVLL